jgi:hypothetical protein
MLFFHLSHYIYWGIFKTWFWHSLAFLAFKYRVCFLSSWYWMGFLFPQPKPQRKWGVDLQHKARKGPVALRALLDSGPEGSCEQSTILKDHMLEKPTWDALCDSTIFAPCQGWHFVLANWVGHCRNPLKLLLPSDCSSTCHLTATMWRSPEESAQLVLSDTWPTHCELFFFFNTYLIWIRNVPQKFMCWWFDP